MRQYDRRGAKRYQRAANINHRVASFLSFNADYLHLHIVLFCRKYSAPFITHYRNTVYVYTEFWYEKNCMYTHLRKLLGMEK